MKKRYPATDLKWHVLQGGRHALKITCTVCHSLIPVNGRYAVETTENDYMRGNDDVRFLCVGCFSPEAKR